MTIQLTTAQIDAALPGIRHGLGQYEWLQSHVARPGPFDPGDEFRKRFNHFYRVRRGIDWQDAYYALMARAKRERLEFPAVLELLHDATGRWEASFASKLVATLDPSKPVIDALVLGNVRLRLPYATAPDRAARICKLHVTLADLSATFLRSSGGEYLVRAFERAYPDADITDEKKLDLVLWKTRSPNPSTSAKRTNEH